MARIDPYDLADDDEGEPDVDRTARDPDQDGVASLRDVEAEAGDESEITDDFDQLLMNTYTEKYFHGGVTGSRERQHTHAGSPRTGSSAAARRGCAG